MKRFILVFLVAVVAASMAQAATKMSAFDESTSGLALDDEAIVLKDGANARTDLTHVLNLETKTARLYWKAPADADDIYVGPFPNAITLGGLYCWSDVGEVSSIIVTVSKCDSAADNCAAIGAEVTANGGVDTDTSLTDTNIAAGAWIKVALSSLTGTVNYLSCGMTYTLTAP